ncbi:MAG TPA: twin-arginine translocase subunit TatC [Chloroflexota bacterium]|nr:twin-arginine translocase subunit TatC [Chloroflexota bacterium]
MSVRSPRPRGVPDPKYMTFVEHLQELRHRLAISLLAIAVGAVAGWFLAPQIIHLIDIPLCQHLPKSNCRLVVTDIYGGFTLQLKIAIIVGFIFALPVTIYEMWAFIAPAFGSGPNRWAPIWMLSALLLFAGGSATAYFVFPLAVSFFTRFQGSNIEMLVIASNYVGFISLIVFVFGISFELPLILVSLSAIGITSSRWLASKRIQFFFGIFIFATIVTPGADWISPLVLGGIMYLLFESSIVVSRMIGK